MSLRPRRQTGLTLLEMVVVLMISGMALALGFQSLGQWRRADNALSSLSERAQRVLLTQRWLNESLRSLTPVAEVPFKGSDSALSGIALNPVIAAQGGDTEIAWRLETDTATGISLVLDEAGRELRLPLPGVSAARFLYLDGSGKSHAQWPPALGVADALPATILLELNDATGDIRVWGSAIAGMRNPVQVLYEIEPD